MTGALETAKDIAAALRHLGWESVEDLHYWAKGNDLDRFDQLVQAFARHRLETEAETIERLRPTGDLS